MCNVNVWRPRKNGEIEALIQNEYIARYIKSLRISWFGNVNRMNDIRMPKKMFDGVFLGPNRRERPRKAWLQDV